MSRKEDTFETPCLSSSRNIFVGLAFVVTGVGRVKNESQELVANQEEEIEAGVGSILLSFTQLQISATACFLILHRHQQTQVFPVPGLWSSLCVLHVY